jgi:hypothetical protein
MILAEALQSPRTGTKVQANRYITHSRHARAVLRQGDGVFVVNTSQGSADTGCSGG